MRLLSYVLLLCVLFTQPSFSMGPFLAKTGLHVAEHIAAGKISEKIDENFSEESVKENGEAKCLQKLEKEIEKLGYKIDYNFDSNFIFDSRIYSTTQEINQGINNLDKKFDDLTKSNASNQSSQSQRDAANNAALKALNSALKNRAQEINSKVAELGLQQKELIKYAKDNSKELKNAKELQAKLTEDAAKTKLCLDSFNSWSLIARACGNKELATKIQSVGFGITKVYESHLAITSISAKVAAGTLTKSAASATLAAGWLGIGMGLLSIASSIFGDDEDDRSAQATEIILEALQQLSKQLSEHHAIMMKEFSGVQEHLRKQDIFMLQNFFELQSGQKDIKERLAKIQELGKNNTTLLQGNVSHIATSLNDLQRITTDNFYALRAENIQDLVDEADQYAKTRMKTEPFNKLKTQLVIKAIERAKEPSVTGGSLDVTKLGDIIKALQTKEGNNLWSHPAFSNINGLRNYGVKNGMLQSDVALVNPIIWLKCCEALVTLFNKKLTTSQYPYDLEVQKLDIENLKKLQTEGEKILKFVEQFGTANNMKKLVEAYAKSLDKLANLVKGEVKEYEESRSKELQSEVKKEIEKEVVQLSTTDVSCKCAVDYSKGNCTYWYNNSYMGGGWYHWPQVKQIADLQYGKEIAFDCTATINEERKKFFETMPQLGNTYLQNIDVSLCKQQSIEQLAKSNIVTPKKDSGYKTILNTPKEIGTLLSQVKSECFLAEQLGVGAIAFEYEVIDNLFYIHTFFNTNKGAKKLITSYKTQYETDKLYDTQREEQLLLFWYGGQYAKSKDYVSERKHLYGNLYRSGFYAPPKEGYKGAKDTFFIDATAVIPSDIEETHKYIKEQLAFAQAKERVQFTQELIKKTQPSSNSNIYEAMKEVDANEALLDSALTLIHNKGMESKRHAETFALFKKGQQSDISDSSSFTHYCSAYVEDPQSAQRPYNVPELIEKTKERKLKAYEEITALNLAPKFEPVASMLSVLKQLAEQYSQRVPYKKEEKKKTESVNDIKEQSSFDTKKQLSDLQSQNKQLTQAVQTLTEQMTQLLSLGKQQQRQTARLAAKINTQLKSNKGKFLVSGKIGYNKKKNLSF